MCGIAGFFDKKISVSEGKDIIRSMTNSIVHRGPDDGGIWSSGDGLYLGHRRLAIIDITPSGAQPMTSISQKSVIVFNGEIYNFKRIQKTLIEHGLKFRGQSDTEVLLEALEHKGYEWVLKNIEGMYAFAYFNKNEQTVLIARDRFGEKPLYYSAENNKFIFGSELKALLSNQFTQKDLDLESISLFFKFNYVPSPKSIFKSIKKLNPGEYLIFDIKKEKVVIRNKYWSYIDGLGKEKLSLSEDEIIKEFECLFLDKVNDQLISDVPIGAFLSGGVDSTAIVTAMTQVSSSKVKTFTIGFNEKEYDESAHAKKIAAHLGTDHTEWIINANTILDLVPRIPEIYDEPFSDSSQLPTYLLSSLTRNKVTVSLSGDGGDELLGGYSRYQWAQSISILFKILPLSSRKILKKILLCIKPEIWNLIGIGQTHFGEKVHKLAKYLDSNDKYELYAKLCSHWFYSEPLLNKEIYISDFDINLKKTRSDNFIDDMMSLDSMHYLPDDIMTKVDRAAMAVSLETRAPFLNHKLVEYCQQLPSQYKMRNGRGKWLLRNFINKHIPSELTNYPKKGFSVPLDHWFRKELKEWVFQKLSNKEMQTHGFFDTKIVNKILDEHMCKKMNWQYHIWDLLVFQEWYSCWISNSTQIKPVHGKPLKDFSASDVL